MKALFGENTQAQKHFKIKTKARCAIVFEGYGINHLHCKLIPLHGTKKDQKWIPINSVKEMNHYFDKYEGYISSHDGLRVSNEELEKVIKEILS